MGTPTFQFHEGEIAVQTRAGAAAMAQRNAAVISTTVLPGAIAFIEKQFMVVLSTQDAAGAVWSSVLFGSPGFVRVKDGNTLAVQVPASGRDAADPLWTQVVSTAYVGLLLIELGSRRRYRINGRVTSLSDDGLELAIDEAYPNCPKYIQRRQLRRQSTHVDAPVVALHGAELTQAQIGIIRRADTLFVASVHAQRGLDASHRGGGVGFVAVLDDGTLRIPDYPGNSLFNTLGNLTSDARCGLLVPDFEGQVLLHLSGTARVCWGQPDPAGLTGGTGRFWEFQVEHWIQRSTPQRLEWEYLDASPFNPTTQPNTTGAA